MSAQLVAVEKLGRQFDVSKPWLERVTQRLPRQLLTAVADVSFDIARQETVALVGESGSGKSTVAKMVVGLIAPTTGDVAIEGISMHHPSRAAERRRLRRRIQMVFQDPYASLNPRMSLRQILEEALFVHRLAGTAAERSERVDELLLMVGLTPRLRDRLPHAISGGQRQRISIARALAVQPELLIADEPVSALDASVQAQIINLLEDLRARLNIALIFIAHDLNVVRHISDRVAVMYLGEVVETAATETLFARPEHPYTRGLLAAIPMPDPKLRSNAPSLEGEVPDPLNPPSGCGFSTRCSFVRDDCRSRHPELTDAADAGHLVRCINPAASTAFEFFKAAQQATGTPTRI
jgi:oligopeptide/dipeptide ABC transporter ATP-binding protein